MKTRFHQTKHQCYLQMEGGAIFVRNKKTGNTLPIEQCDFVQREKAATLTDADWSDWTEVDSPFDAYEDWQSANQENRKNLANERLQKMEEIKRRAGTASLDELYSLVSWLATLHQGNSGWDACDIMIGAYPYGSNSLSRALSSWFGCGYTASPFDDGNIILKGRDGRGLALNRDAKRESIYLTIFDQ